MAFTPSSSDHIVSHTIEGSAMFTVKQNDSGWYNIIYNGHLAAVVPSKDAAHKSIQVIKARLKQ
jgi:hypothetical protein